MKKIILGTLVLLSLSFSSDISNISKNSSYTMDYDKNSTCVVRQLKVYKEPKWVSKIILANLKSLYFCSPKSMLEFYLHPGKWDHFGVKSEEDFEEIAVTDYNTLKVINGRKAFFVYGSRAISPAGDDLVVFENEKDAQKFAKEYNGKRILRFSEIKMSLINLLNNRI